MFKTIEVIRNIEKEQDLKHFEDFGVHEKKSYQVDKLDTRAGIRGT